MPPTSDPKWGMPESQVRFARPVTHDTVNFGVMASPMAAEFLEQAIIRAGPSSPVTEVARNVAAALTEGEVVLEVADSTAAGFHSAVFVTNRRLLLGNGPGDLIAVNLDQVTGYSFTTDVAPNLKLNLESYDARLSWTGFGELGRQHITHALDWVFGRCDGTNPAPKPETSIGEIHDAWDRLHREFASREELSETERQAGMVDVLANKRWW